MSRLEYLEFLEKYGCWDDGLNHNDSFDDLIEQDDDGLTEAELELEYIVLCH